MTEPRLTHSHSKSSHSEWASSTNGKHGRDRIIHEFLLMSWNQPSSTMEQNLKHIVHQTFIALLSALAALSSASPPPPERQPPRANSEGQQEVRTSRTVSRPIGHRGAGLSAWTLTCWSRALSRSDTCVPTVSESSWLVKSRGGKAARPGKRSATFRGAPRWIIQTVPVATISVDMFPHLWTLAHIYTYTETHTDPAS